MACWNNKFKYDGKVSPTSFSINYSLLYKNGSNYPNTHTNLYSYIILFLFFRLTWFKLCKVKLAVVTSPKLLRNEEPVIWTIVFILFWREKKKKAGAGIWSEKQFIEICRHRGGNNWNVENILPSALCWFRSTSMYSVLSDHLWTYYIWQFQRCTNLI